MDRRMILLGGGELKNRETLKIDEYIAGEAKRHAGEKRAMGLFLPTASHDCMPYYNTFHKVYTGVFDIKTDVVLTVNREFDIEKIREKFLKADFLYTGGGNTVFMIEEWKRTGVLELVKDAYARGVIICGLSAGAICYFEDMYSDSVLEGEYQMWKGLGILKGKICPHYNERMLDFDEIVRYNRWKAMGIENCAAVEYKNEEAVKTHSCGGKVWLLDGEDGEMKKRELVLR